MLQTFNSVEEREYLYLIVVLKSPNYTDTVIISYIHFSIHHTDLHMKTENFFVIHKQRSLALKVQFKHDLKMNSKNAEFQRITL